MDGSGSIGTSNFEKEKDFVKDLCNGFKISPNETKVSLITFTD